VKPGDLVRLVATRFPIEWRGAVGIITEMPKHDVWIALATHPGTGVPTEIIIQKSDVRIVGIELSDEHLEHVLGGMSPQKFSIWRSNLLNSNNDEDR
jgi:hypothetical protein